MIQNERSNAAAGLQNVTFLFPHEAVPLVSDVMRKRSPRERLYGALELEGLGWRVDYADERWTGRLARSRRSLRGFVELPSTGICRRFGKTDIAIVKDEFAVANLIEARIAGCKIVYLDAMFDPPKRFWRRWSARLNLRYADRVIALSRAQASQWESEYGLPGGKIAVLPFCMDTEFYPTLRRERSNPPFMLAVGRDLGRDYATLVRAAELADINVKLVTLPYLLPPDAASHPRVEVLGRVSYDVLFDLYSRAAASIVPLKPGITYPSGIRAVMEGVLLGVPTVCTWTPTLEEYFQQDDHVRYVSPRDAQQLANEMSRVVQRPEETENRAAAANEFARSKYRIERFGEELHSMLLAL